MALQCEVYIFVAQLYFTSKVITNKILGRLVFDRAELDRVQGRTRQGSCQWEPQEGESPEIGLILSLTGQVAYLDSHLFR
jgi:hypothetical protein